jgi:acyl carrier protein
MPIDNVVLAVLDELRRPVAAGIEGELWIGGAGVGLGYLGRPTMNAERFMELGLPGYSGRMYRTGDRVVARPDGTLAFLGRFDHQIKIRGFRVELGEIEAALDSHAAIREACVTVHQPDAAEPRLIAYVVAHGDAPAADDLRRHVAQAVPDHMVPSAFVTLAAMPLSPNGKIDRHALPAPGRPVGVAAPVAAVGTEGAILEIWQTVLGRRPDSREQTFFDAGGTSLSMAEVQGAIRQRLGRDIPIVTLFAYPTIASLARHLDQDRPAQGVARMAGLKQVEAMRKLAMARGRRP